MVTCGDDKKIIVYDINEKGYNKLAEINGLHSRCIYSWSWSKTSNWIATGGSDNKVYVSRVEYNDECNVTPILQSPPGKGHETDVNWVAFHHTSNILASCSDDRTIKIWSWNL